MTKCVRCNKEKSDDQFIGARGQPTTQCKDCRFRDQAVSEEQLKKKREQCRAWRAKNKERVRLYNEHKRKEADGFATDWNDIKEEKNITNNVIGKPSPHRKLHSYVNGVEGKSCSKCKEWKPLTSYNNMSKSWDGLRTDCKDCLYEYRAGRKEDMTEYNKEYWIKTKDIQTEKNKIWKEANRDHVNEYSKNYAKTWRLKQLEINPKYKIIKNLRCRLYHAIKFGYGVKSDSTLDLLSCTLDYFQEYIAAKFQDGMTWENYGKWHIDHIIPCNSWDLSKPEEVRMCFHYLNLQPMWGGENSAKRDRFDQKDKDKYIKLYNSTVKNKKRVSNYTQKQRLNDFYELNEWVGESGGILLSNICDLKGITTNLNVFCQCGNTFSMCYLDMGSKWCEICDTNLDSSLDFESEPKVKIKKFKTKIKSVEI
jgi:hypothetical protein